MPSMISGVAHEGLVLSYHPRFDEVTKLEFEIKRKVTK